jgi:hypothetical protein
VRSRDRERFARARRRGHAREQDRTAAVKARYDAERRGIELTFRAGVSMTIPRQIVPGLDHASRSSLDAVQLSRGGDALSWPELDVHVSISGLVERAFGSRLFATGSGRASDRGRTRAKDSEAKPAKPK